MTVTSQYSATNTNQSSADKPSSGLSSAMSDVKHDLQELGSDTKVAAGEIKHCAEHELEHAKELAHQGGEQVQEWHKTFRSNVSRHPTTAVLITLGVGAVLGRLFAGR